MIWYAILIPIEVAGMPGAMRGIVYNASDDNDAAGEARRIAEQYGGGPWELHRLDDPVMRSTEIS